MKNFKKIIQTSIITCLFCSTTCWAVLPPKYLSIDHWKDCMGTMTQGSAQFICRPAEQPAACPDESWEKLGQLNEVEDCPAPRN